MCVPLWEYMKMLLLIRLRAERFACFWSFFSVKLETNFQVWQMPRLSFETLKAEPRPLKTKKHKRKQNSQHKTRFYEFGRNKQRAIMISSVGHAHKFCIRLLIARFAQMILTKRMFPHMLVWFISPLCPLVANYTNSFCLRETKCCSLPTWHCKSNVTFISGGSDRDPQSYLQTNIWLMKCTKSLRQFVSSVMFSNRSRKSACQNLFLKC